MTQLQVDLINFSPDRTTTHSHSENKIPTTSSRAALRPKEQVSRVRQLMKEVKRSLGRAIKVLRGNMVMRLEMMLEMPTASESSISILATGMLKMAFTL